MGKTGRFQEVHTANLALYPPVFVHDINSNASRKPMLSANSTARRREAGTKT